jgi:hypothetical protein
MASYGINVADGTPPAGYTMPGPGDPFVWLNYDTTTSVTIANCGNWCFPASCTVPAAVGDPVVPGQHQATVLDPPNAEPCAFSDTGWDAPGMPHVGLSPWPKRKQEKDVA